MCMYHPRHATSIHLPGRYLVFNHGGIIWYYPRHMYEDRPDYIRTLFGQSPLYAITVKAKHDGQSARTLNYVLKYG